jgi:Co-chaperonin GroES (HSP10)
MIKPLHDNVVLEKKELETEMKTASGIILTDTKKEEPSIAKVVAVGAGIYQDGKLVSIDLKEGQKVVYKKYATTEIEIDGKEYYIVSADSILAVIE